MECEAVTAIVDFEIQRLRVTLGILADTKAHHLRAVLTPRLEIGGFEAHVTDTDDVHVIHLVIVRDERVPVAPAPTLRVSDRQ
ncbi:hypothetical protein D3C81_2120530 [compost metagenome]